jgi:hypothetical protein
MKKLSFNEAKFPHLTTVKESVEQLTLYIEKLHKRKQIIAKGKDVLSTEYEKNEDEISIIKTDWELAKSYKNLAEKTDYVKNFTAKLLVYIDEVNEKYTEVSNKAKLYFNANSSNQEDETAKAIGTEYENIKDADLDDNWEIRIKHYIVLRTIFEEHNKKK